MTFIEGSLVFLVIIGLLGLHVWIVATYGGNDGIETGYGSKPDKKERDND